MTKVAMMMMKQAIRTLAGMTFLSRLTRILEQSSTKVVANPMPMPFFMEVVTPSTGQSPRTSRNGGTSFQRPLVNSEANDLAIE